MIFSEEKRIFSKSLNVAILHWNAYQMIILLKNVFSALIMRYFVAKYQNLFQVGKLRIYYEVFRRKRNVFFVQKPSLRKWQSANYAGGSRPSCFVST